MQIISETSFPANLSEWLVQKTSFLNHSHLADIDKKYNTDKWQPRTQNPKQPWKTYDKQK